MVSHYALDRAAQDFLFLSIEVGIVQFQKISIPTPWTLMSRTERRYCSASTSYMTGLLANFIQLHI